MIPHLPSPGPRHELVATVLWRADDGDWLDRCQLRQLGGFTNRHYRLSGTVIGVDDGRPIRIRYRVDLDRGWRTRDVLVRHDLGGVERSTDIVLKRRGRWQRLDPASGQWQRLEALDGLADIDLAFTPATNMLPIRRLDLPVGGSAAVTAAWLRFPEMTLEPLQQTYTRAADREYRYTSPGFEATITVDEHGLVRDYSGLWLRVAQHP